MPQKMKDPETWTPLMRKRWDERGTFPHCDHRVLHSPGTCEVCDEHAADLQAERKRLGIPFTDELPDDAPLLGLVGRTAGSSRKWGGNRPSRPGGPLDGLGYPSAGATDAP